MSAHHAREPRRGRAWLIVNVQRLLGLALGGSIAIVVSLAGCESGKTTGLDRPRTDAARPLFDPIPDSAPPEPEGSRLPYGMQVTLGVKSWGDWPETVIGSPTRRFVAIMKIRQKVFEIRSGYSIKAGPLGAWLPTNECILRARMYSREWNWAAGPEVNTNGCRADGEPDVAAVGPVTLSPALTIYGNRRWGTGNCGGCYAYSGSGTYYVTPAARTLQVKAVPKRLVTGYEVKFTASRSNGVALPAVESWHWIPADTSKPRVALTKCGTSATCTDTAKESGWAVANAVIDGDLETAKAHVEVLGCRTGDPVLDNVDVRDAAAVLWDSSYDSTNRSNGRERTMLVFDSAGTLVPRIMPIWPGEARCKSSWIKPNPAPGKLVASLHTHPYVEGDTMPTDCPVKGTYSPDVYRGMSANDLWSTISTSPRLNVYTVDVANVSRADSLMNRDDFEPAGNRGMVPKRNRWQSHVTHWPRHQSTGGVSCSIIKA